MAVIQASEAIPEAREMSGKPARFDDYEVHYSAFNSTFIAPDIAGQYGLERSPRRGIVNIAIRNLSKTQVGEAVAGQLQGSVSNLLGQKTALDFKVVREGEATYYLAGFRISGQELLKFSIDVTPQGGKRETVQFEQAFYQ
ncbi:MAG: DUF4426 domain-containing protein [Endozoicomonas sp.]